ncbi:ABC transporter substrate binding protein (PQQ-dependent alcohol dehydrogenase system) [Methylorubrum rhodinum]|uniref:ABC transporter substrate binding protein (PQQ-dependent alcohol dehydrogenase system) n=1 Tax=Methylorubrum rhodinum TaxID=29428 RepID=A0A840ZJG7_9HYPH|nr:ABC transporter substrate-binding protein [Methylorubrum rhodinum]MBB5757087.1 ABC transporter substrate binding protein (PQQ-dependent alcohol dehydrogenase system) [Methylorubrum rhodinum]
MRVSPSLLLALAFLAGIPAAQAQEPKAATGEPPPAPPPQAGGNDTHIAMIYRPVPAPSSYDAEAEPEDLGVAGARMAVKDNNTTGRFTKQTYALDEVALEPGQDAVAAAKDLAAKGVKYFALTLPAEEVLAVADALKEGDAVVLNAGAPDDRLRGADCRANVFHTIPSRAMQTDALAQYMTLMRWRKIFLIVGPTERDKAYADALKNSAKKFGLKITAEKPWTFGPLAKARGDTPTRAEAMVFTRGLDYDMAVVADEEGDWGDYVPFRTVDPRPVAGTQGLIATTWHPTLETWGAAQAQNRFRRQTGRLMKPLDYQAWAAIRTVGEAATQKKTTDIGVIRPYLTTPEFSLPAYKGVSLTYRPWDHQLRQPIIVVQPKAMVSVAPEQGFIHQRTPLDTLGTDEPETTCKLK